MLDSYGVVRRIRGTVCAVILLIGGAGVWWAGLPVGFWEKWETIVGNGKFTPGRKNRDKLAISSKGEAKNLEMG